MSEKIESDFNIVTEVGVFGDLNINDPTKKKIKQKDEDIDTLIKEAVEKNAHDLSK
jgi:hypothetical protein